MRRRRNPALFESEENLRKAFLSGCVALLLAALVWAGGDPWKSKPYQQWDAKDVRKVLDASPWAHSVQVEAPWISADGAGDADSGGTSSQPGPARAGPSARSGPGGGGVDNGAGGPQTAALATFLVRWTSSRTVREAVLRNAILAGQIKGDAAAQQLAQPVETYEIVVAGPDMKPFQSVDEKILEHGAFLMTGKRSKKSHPSARRFRTARMEKR